ncbi:MAG TPA: hypothetical protein VMW08_01040 [Acidimicrobiales bacterium]|nr:hypothetical protein [Acidimicrobiales bacterium]
MRLVLVLETGDDRGAGAPALSFGEVAKEPDARPPAGWQPPDPEGDEPPTGDGRLEAAWEALVAAQRRLVDHLGESNADDHARKLWVGGALAIYALATGETEDAVALRLGDEVQVPTIHGMRIRAPHETTQAPKHPGAQEHHEDYDEPPERPADPGLAGYQQQAPDAGLPSTEGGS